MKEKFREYKGLNLVEVANEVLLSWEKEQTFNKSIENRAEAESYVFYEGPPSANGMPGIHHVMARTIKDIFCRFQTLKGKKVQRKAGWDTHGLPVELGVEKELQITKEDIGVKISVEQYNKACREAVMRYTDVWNDLTHKMGYWVDLENPYITYESKYMESVWWLLKQIYNKDLMYKGYTIQPYSPAAGTGLSSHELNMPGTYKDVTDTTIVAQFKVVKEGSKNFSSTDGEVFFLAWTTTPWTLPSNTALTVGKKIEYVKISTFNQYTFEPIQVILAKNLVSKQFGKKYTEAENIEALSEFKEGDKKIPFFVESEYLGADLVGEKYEQLLPWAVPCTDADKAFVVIDGDFVTTEDGTGIVHTAPTFGADDAMVAKNHGVPGMLVLDENDNEVPLVDLQGKFIESLPEGFGGKFVKNEYYKEDAPEKSIDVEIAILLKTENRAFKVEKYKHSYPHCWRTDKPVLYYPLDSWFIKVTAVKDRLVELNKTINWKPASTGEGRFGKWLENANDWNLSRSRYWGIPIPVWKTEDGKESICIGSVEELMVEIEKSVEKGIMSENPYADFVVGDMSKENYDKIDLHKNYVDNVVLCSLEGKPMYRESDLIDVWFDSGAMPYAQWHYPFENKDKLEGGAFYPADFIAEGVDQTRGWFYTLHTISTLVFDKVAYKNVVSNGLVLDKNGQKMSKRLGNGVDPFEVMEKYGPDATRWYMIGNAQPWENLKFDLEGIDEVRKKFFGTLYNTYSFFSLYANVDGFNYSEPEIPLEKRDELDRWILSELHTLIRKVEDAFSQYEPTRAVRLITSFVTDDLSNWHVRLSRRRFWKGEYTEDKIAAYQTLYTCLKTIAQLGAPVAPFYMDALYKDLLSVSGESQSVHLSDFPKYDASFINEDLQESTRIAQRLTSMVFSLRKKENIKVRQPLQKVMIPVLSDKLEKQVKAVAELVKNETNVKELNILSSEKAKDLIVKQVKPNFKVLGPRFGKEMKKIAAVISGLESSEIQTLESEGKISVDFDGTPTDVLLEEVEISTKDVKGWLVASEGNLTVALDIELSQELIEEGIARELVNRIQSIRKEKDFELTDRIQVVMELDKYLEKAISNNTDYICQETLSDKISFTESLTTDFEEIEIEQKSLKISVKIV